MKTADLLLSGLNITEDEYHYIGSFILAGNNKTLNVDMSDLESAVKLDEIRNFFELEEKAAEVKNIIMELVVEKAAISSKFNEGEAYSEDMKRKKTEYTARSLDVS